MKGGAGYPSNEAQVTPIPDDRKLKHGPIWKTANAVGPNDGGTRAKCPKATKRSERHEGRLPEGKDTAMNKQRHDGQRHERNLPTGGNEMTALEGNERTRNQRKIYAREEESREGREARVVGCELPAQLLGTPASHPREITRQLRRNGGKKAHKSRSGGKRNGRTGTPIMQKKTLVKGEK